MALIITLLMLAVITFLAITFLFLSHQERGAVTTTTDQLTADNAAETALERAKVELLAPMLAFNNNQAFRLMVSTNFYNRAGFDPYAFDYRTNVNYDYTVNGLPLTTPQLEQNLSDLLYDPRPPVFVTNRFTRTKDFRYYLDLNRNGEDDPNGLWPVTGPTPNPPYFTYYDTNGLPIGPNLPPTKDVLSNYFVGDPEWIGVLQHPDWPYSASNRFIARYAYLVVPVGQTLDANYIYNDAKMLPTMDPQNAQDGFLRNEGIGTWEINLAAFLADLNTNYWDPPGAAYDYYPLNAAGQAQMTSPNQGRAFEDALSLLRYRYNGSYNNLLSASDYLNGNSVDHDQLDEYVDGPFMLGTALPVPDNDKSGTPGWAGADNPNHFFTPQDFFDAKKILPPTPLPGFVDRLRAAGTNVDSYNRYTFYRMLAQLGTASTPERDKMNLNYYNMVGGKVVPGAESRMIPWGRFPMEFFTNAAQRILTQMNMRDLYGNLITVTNIPIYMPHVEWTNNPNTGQSYLVTNILDYYNPAVQRALQLAANLFEATTNTLYPCVYRPYFSSYVSTNGWTNVIISGYELVNGPDNRPTDQSFYDTPAAYPIDLNIPVSRDLITQKGTNTTHLNVYGAPWIIGARKGFPNLNNVTINSYAEITRKLQFTRPSPSASFSQYQTRQMYIVGISNAVGVEVWNSYRDAYPRQTYIRADDNYTMSLTNEFGMTPIILSHDPVGILSLPAGGWQGTQWTPGSQFGINSQSFLVPLFTNIDFLPNAVYQPNPPGFDPVPYRQAQDWGRIQPGYFPQPHWGLNITNRIRCIILDGGGPGIGRVVDYVQFRDLTSFRDLGAELYTRDAELSISNMWSTNAMTSFLGPMPQGMLNQIYVSMGQPETSDQDWQNTMVAPPTGDARLWAIASFADFMHQKPTGDQYPQVDNRDNVVQAPFSPTSKRVESQTWEANDPLIHYTAPDLYYPEGSIGLKYVPPNGAYPSMMTNFYQVNVRYSPWGGRPHGTSNPKEDYNLAIKDPLVWSSDYWDFPTNVLPNVGWIGRVHRGTPWQTVYLKSTPIDVASWMKWTGDTNRFYNGSTNNFSTDASYTAPTNDWRLFDLFTTAISDNATRSQLSVNQTNLAAWSAVLSGVIALTNTSEHPDMSSLPSNHWYVIQPAGVYAPQDPPPVVRIVDSINQMRSSTNYNGSFHSLGEILSAPALTVNSPFLNWDNSYQQRFGISDEMYERLPQQIMSLLTLRRSPEFVVYAFGQTLHPAPNSIITSGNYFLMCTNYQVTAETAARAVVKVEGSLDPKYAKTPDPSGNYYPPHIVVEQYNVLPPN